MQMRLSVYPNSDIQRLCFSHSKIVSSIWVNPLTAGVGDLGLTVTILFENDADSKMTGPSCPRVI